MIVLSERKIYQFPRFFMLLSVPLVLFGLSILGFLNIIPLKVEPYSLVILFLILIIFMFFITHNAWYSFSHFRNNMNKVLEEIDVYLLENELSFANKKKSYGNIDSFFKTHIKNIRNDNFASVAASIFPTLGILGTFTAIAISMPDFSVASQSALEKEISILLSGIGTAFYASIYGIFLSLWWVFFEKRGLTKIQKEIEEIKIQYKNSLWNKEELEILTLLDYRHQNEKIFKKIQSVITPEYIFKLDEIAKSKINLLEKLNNDYRTSEQRVTKNYMTLIKLFEDSTIKQNKILEDFDKLHDSISKTNDLLSNSLNEQSSHSKAIKTEIYTVLSSFELVSSDLKNLGKDLINNNIQK